MGLKCPHDEYDGDCGICDPGTAFYSKAYNLLIEHCGIRDDDMRDTFIRHFVEQGGMEWRFQGKLGFGGKFWHTGRGWDINCYREDETKELKALIKTVNGLLADLAAELGVKP